MKVQTLEWYGILTPSLVLPRRLRYVIHPKHVHPLATLYSTIVWNAALLYALQRKQFSPLECSDYNVYHLFNIPQLHSDHSVFVCFVWFSQ